jgi:hypothetical protein
MSFEQDDAGFYLLSQRRGSLLPAFRPHRLLAPAAGAQVVGEPILASAIVEIKSDAHRGD